MGTGVLPSFVHQHASRMISFCISTHNDYHPCQAQCFILNCQKRMSVFRPGVLSFIFQAVESLKVVQRQVDGGGERGGAV